MSRTQERSEGRLRVTLWAELYEVYIRTIAQLHKVADSFNTNKTQQHKFNIFYWIFEFFSPQQDSVPCYTRRRKETNLQTL